VSARKSATVVMKKITPTAIVKRLADYAVA
jgi:hypothetical protein